MLGCSKPVVRGHTQSIDWLIDRGSGCGIFGKFGNFRGRWYQSELGFDWTLDLLWHNTVQCLDCSCCLFCLLPIANLWTDKVQSVLLGTDGPIPEEAVFPTLNTSHFYAKQLQPVRDEFWKGHTLMACLRSLAINKHHNDLLNITGNESDILRRSSVR
jgi:hypothetical protein